MKCGAWIIRYVNGKKSGKIYGSFHSGILMESIASIVTNHNKRSENKVEFTEFCDGEMSIEIESDEEPCFGGAYPVVRIKHICSKCGEVYNPNLPTNEYDLNDFVNKTIDDME